MGIRWESMWERRGNVGIGLGFPEGRYRIQFAASLDVEVGRRSKPCLRHGHVVTRALTGSARDATAHPRCDTAPGAAVSENRLYVTYALSELPFPHRIQVIICLS